MHITQEATYAVRIIDCLANSDSRQNAERIAEQTGVSLRFALKIMRKLRMAGLIQSHKGPQGGYELTKKPGEISLKDVIEIVDGPIMINPCEKNGVCSKVENVALCEYFAIFKEMSETLRGKLDAIHFDRKSNPPRN